jgi:hypothetical protein
MSIHSQQYTINSNLNDIPTIKALDFLGRTLFLDIVVFSTQKKPRKIEHLQNQEPFSKEIKIILGYF